MPDTFARLIPEARAYLKDLAANNDRAWFAANKDRYDATLRGPATLLMDQVAADLAGQIGQVTTKLFRPQRDVRFSKDKTPYNTHLHMMWDLSGAGIRGAGLFFGISPEYVSAGGGVMAFDKPALEAWRHSVDGPAGAELSDDLGRLSRDGFRIDPPELKRVPPPYPPDHPQGDLLRRKGLVIWHDLSEADFAAPRDRLRALFERLQPVLNRLQEAIQPD